MDKILTYYQQYLNTEQIYNRIIKAVTRLMSPAYKKEFQRAQYTFKPDHQIIIIKFNFKCNINLIKLAAIFELFGFCMLKYARNGSSVQFTRNYKLINKV